MNSIYLSNDSYRVKLGRAVTFMKYLVSAVSLISLAKNFFWNKTTFPTSNSLNLKELLNEPMNLQNEPMSLQKELPIFFFYSIYHCLM